MSEGEYREIYEFGSAFPFYLVIDVSPSMWNKPIVINNETFTPLNDVKEWCQAILVLLRETTYTDKPSSGAAEISLDVLDFQYVRDRGHLGIIAFGDNAKVVMPLTPIRQLAPIDIGKRLQDMANEQNKTVYGEVFHTLNDVIQADDIWLSSQYSERQRPAVFFITDGIPTDPTLRWYPEYRRLEQLGSDNDHAPGIAAIGFGNANRDVIAQVATRSHGGIGLLQKTGVSPEYGVVGKIFEFVLKSVALSARNEYLSTPGSLEGFDYIEPEGY